MAAVEMNSSGTQFYQNSSVTYLKTEDSLLYQKLLMLTNICWSYLFFNHSIVGVVVINATLTLSLPNIFLKLFATAKLKVAKSRIIQELKIWVTEVATGSMIGSESVMSTLVANGVEPGDRL